MGGGLMQLVAYGAQDIYLTGNPQITFFKVVYRRHTNFAIETVPQSLTGDVTAGTTEKICSSIISRNGDLITNLYVTSSTVGIINGDNIIEEATIEIGGQRIDKHYKEWMQIWSELTIPESKIIAYKNMIGSFNHKLNNTGTTGSGMVQIPLLFWFCRNPGLALPLIALQYHEVKIKLTLGKNTNIGEPSSVTFYTESPSSCDAVVDLWVDYIYLDTDERRRFAQVSHEYLIEQLQRIESSNKTTHNLNLNHPVKEIIWTSPMINAYVDAKIQLNGHDRFREQEEEYFQLRQPFNYHTSIPGTNLSLRENSGLIYENINSNLKLKNITNFINSAATLASGQAKLINGKLTFFTTDEPSLLIGDILMLTSSNSTQILNITEITSSNSQKTYRVNYSKNDQFHSNNVSQSTGTIKVISRLQNPLSRCSSLNKRINIYSFSLQPEEHQPSGTCNFSRIDNAKLIFNSEPGGNINIYATNYNVLRIMSGMGGLAYSN